MSWWMPLLLAADPWWGAVPWGASLPAEARPERDYPWAAAPSDQCGWTGDLLLCAGASGVDRAYRPHVEPVVGGERLWLRTAGLEWRSGWVSAAPGPGERVALRWGQHQAPFEGWDILAPSAPSAEPRAPRPVRVEGLGRLGAAGAGVLEALSRCGGAALDRLPLVVLYDPSGEARLVRFQAFPPDDLDGACVSAAVGGPARPPGVARHLELMISLGP